MGENPEEFEEEGKRKEKIITPPRSPQAQGFKRRLKTAKDERRKKFAKCMAVHASCFAN